jgi:hypothetical protein
MLTTEQLATLKAAILADTDPEFVAARTAGATGAMAAFYNVAATPAFYVWRRSLSRHEILTGTSDDNTTFAWAAGAYITRSQGERDAFREMFNSTGSVDPSLASIQAAFNDIFSGAGGAGNRTHIVAMSRRPVSRVERLFATGTGSKAAPGVANFEGDISGDVISTALSD